MGKNASETNESPVVKEVAIPAVEKAATEDFKAQGNAALKDGKFQDAVKFYTQAIAEAPESYVLYSNRCAAYTSLEKYDDAEDDARKCIKLSDSKWSKGFSRLGTSLYFLKRYEESILAFKAGLAIEPDSAALKDGLKQSTEKLNESAPKTEKKTEEDNLGPIIGIDLGTTYSCVAVWKDDGVIVIPDEEGNKTTPSVVGFRAGGERSVGWAAKAQAASNPTNTIYDVKRILGHAHMDGQLVKDSKRFPFRICETSKVDDKPVIEVVQADGSKERFAPEEISAMVLVKMKQVAEKHLNTKIQRAVITVPAYFSDAQRQATKDAGAIAGLQVLRIINEPTAAALAYGLDLNAKEARKIVVFDLGGGTFDVSILNIDGGIFEVLATGGDTHLGGEDFDANTVDWLAAEAIKQSPGFEVTKDLKKMERLRIEAEAAKRRLSANKETKIDIDGFLPNGKDFSIVLTKDIFDNLNKEPFNRCIETVKKVLKDAKVGTEEVDDVVLVGGSTRILSIQEKLTMLFNGKNLCKSINPDEAVAYGAAVQGAILSGVRHALTTSLLLVDVTPLSLGIETVGKIFSTVIPRNTQIPVERTKTYSTEEDNQSAIDVLIYEGERSCTEGNNLLGEFTIHGIERAKRGVPQIEVHFSVDSNGILSVSARDKITNVKAGVTIAANRGRLSTHDIARMVQEAEKFKAVDEERVALVEAKNELEMVLYEVKAAEKAPLHVQEVEQWLEGFFVGVGAKEAGYTVQICKKKKSELLAEAGFKQ